MCLSMRRFFRLAASVAAATSLASCIAVGPDFLHPAAPPVGRYTKEPLPARTSSTDAPTGRPQRFAPGGDIPQQWWRLFRSPALNALIERALRPAVDDVGAARREGGRLRAARQVLPARPGQLQPDAPANCRSHNARP